jgi:hypothetical protein
MDQPICDMNSHNAMDDHTPSAFDHGTRIYIPGQVYFKGQKRNGFL